MSSRGGVRIDSLHLDVAGVSPELAEAALAGLDAELRRRLANPRLRLLDSPSDLRQPAPLEIPPRIDATTLRHLLADRLVELLAPQSHGDADTGEAS